MENYVGKICPYCKTVINADDEVMVCPSCTAPHHKACWEENNGCTTFGCSEQHYVAQGMNPTDVCKKCGAALGENQDVCPMCGTPKNAPEKIICAKCGAEVAEGYEFCPKCGQKVGLAIDSDVSFAISQFNSNVIANNEKKEKKKKRKKKPIIITILLSVLVALGIGGFIVYNKVVEQKEIDKKLAEQKEIARIEELEDGYKNDAGAFAVLVTSAGANVEDIANTIEEYWGDYIYNNRYGSIELAILEAQIDKSNEIEQAKKDFDLIKGAYDIVKKIPEGVNDSEIDDICDAIKDMYNIYTDYYSFATEPTGSYKTFSENNQSKKDEFISAYHALNNLLD